MKKQEGMITNLFTNPSQDREDQETRAKVGQVILDGELGDEVADAEKMDDDALEGVLSRFGFSDEDSDSYFEKISDMVDIMKNDFKSSDMDIIEALKVNLDVKLEEAKQIYKDVRLLV